MDETHEPECDCSICAAVAGGKTMEEALEEARQWELQMLAKHGWFSHIVGHDSDYPTEFNAHTHGLAELSGHPDFQIVYPLPPEKCQFIFKELADRVKAGERFAAGQVVGEIVRGYSLKLVAAEENDRPVLRVIIPGPDGALERNAMPEPYNLQYADLQND